MRVCMVVYELLEFGGLEGYAVDLATALQDRGHRVSLVCLTRVPPDNQYRRQLRDHGVPFVQFPRWVWKLAPDWVGRERLVARLAHRLGPLVWLLAGLIVLVKRRSWSAALVSARGWLAGQLWRRGLGAERREAIGRALLRWWRWRWRPDLLHIHGYTSFLPFVLDWAHAAGLPTVYEEHQTPDPRFDWWGRFKLSINQASLVAAVSETSAKALRQVCGVTRPIVIIPRIFADPLEAGWQPERAAHAEGGPLRLTTVARLETTKGLAYLLEAVARVRQHGPAARLAIYGEGSLRQELLEHAERLGLDGSAILAGAFHHRDLPRVMAETDVFVLPSIIEGMPLSLVEAMAYGRPILATQVGGAPDLIEHGQTGLLCPPGDPECLAQHLIALIEDEPLRVRLGQAARQGYERGPFHPSAACEHALSIYRRAIEIGRPSAAPGQT